MVALSLVPLLTVGESQVQTVWTEIEFGAFYATESFDYGLGINASVFRLELLKNLLDSATSADIQSSDDLGCYLQSQREVLMAKFSGVGSMVDAVCWTVPDCNPVFSQCQELGKRIDVQQKRYGFRKGLRLDENRMLAYQSLTEFEETEAVWIPRIDEIPNFETTFTEKSHPPLVSVVIPCFNYGRYVSEAVQSVRDQTLEGIEIIVVDGGSDDEITLPVLRQLEQTGLTVYYRGSRQYVGNNRNFGIERCKGRFVCCLDADDKLDSTYLEKALFHLVGGGYDVVGSGAVSFGAYKKHLGVIPVVEQKDILEANAVMSASLFRKSLWEQVGGYEDFGIGEAYVFEDWHFWCKCALAGARFLNLEHEYLIRYRVHGDESLSHQRGAVKSDREHGEIIRAHLDGREFNYNRDYLSSENEGEDVFNALAELHASLAFPGKTETFLVIVDVYEPTAIKGILDYLNPYLAHGHQLVVAITQNTGKFEKRDYRALRGLQSVFDLDRFLGTETEKSVFLHELIATRSIRTVFRLRILTLSASFTCILCEIRTTKYC